MTLYGNRNKANTTEIELNVYNSCLVDIKIEDCVISQQEIEKVTRNSPVTTIQILHTNITGDKKVTRLPRTLKQLKIKHVPNNVLSLLKSSRSLRHLTLQNCNLSPPDMRVLRKFNFLKSLMILDGFSDKHIEEFCIPVKGIKKRPPNSKTLREIYLFSSGITNQLASSIHMAKYCSGKTWIIIDNINNVTTLACFWYSLTSYPVIIAPDTNDEIEELILAVRALCLITISKICL